MDVRQTTVDVITVEILLPVDGARRPPPRYPEQRIHDAIEALHALLPPALRWWTVQEAHVEERPLWYGDAQGTPDEAQP